jgi:Cdc6-like AAA superfamily ATPase
MNENQKKEIQLLTQQYVNSYDSQAKAAASIKDTSEATIINILKGRWDGISPEMWRNVGKQVGYSDRKSTLVETLNFSTLLLYYSIAREHGETFALVARAGGGKSFTGKWYTNNMKGKNVYYIECAEHWNKKYFLLELLEAMGKNAGGLNIYEMMKLIVTELRKQDHPLIIIDEVDKLDDKTLLFFITLYNQLHGLCGIVWTSTDAIVKRVDKAVSKNRIGFNEIFSRLGRKFIELPGLSKEELREICKANGISDEVEVNKVLNTCEGDVRRINRAYIQQLTKQSYKKSA